MPPPPNSPHEGPELVEPDQPDATVDLDALDTGRILRETGSLTLPPTDDADDADDDHEGSPPPEDSRGQDTASPKSGLNILSIIALLLALAVSPFAMIFGYIAVGQARRSHQRGEAVAWVAVGLGWLWTIAYVVIGVTLGATWLQL